MSVVDNRLVKMQFDNAQFEKGIKESTKSLDSFKKSLDLKGAEAGLNEIQRAGNSIDLSHISNGVDKISERFSALGIIGMRVLENLADSAYRVGTRLISSLTIDQVSAGFSKYEDKTKAVQTIVNATGLEIEQVNEQLSKLAWFTDETSYSFVDMVSNIGKFTSMQIPLDQSVTAMEGIATWAAVSGQGIGEASRAMYNLSQAMGVGAVKLMDWKSIENANMATAEFKQTAIDTAKALKTLDKAGKTAKGTAVNFKNFSSTLQDGWFTSDVLLKTLEKYGEYADEVYKISSEEGITAAQAMERLTGSTMSLGEKAFRAAQEAKTFSEALEAVKDAVSTGWMNTFELVFGNYEEAKVIWTDLANGLYDVFASGFEGWTDILKEWKEKGGRDDLLSGIYDIFSALYGIIQTVKDAMAEVFPPITVEKLLEISRNVKEFGANLKVLFGYEEKETEELNNVADAADKAGLAIEKRFGKKLRLGDRGKEVKELQEELIKLGYLERKNADGYFGLKTQEALKKLQKEMNVPITGNYDLRTFKAMTRETEKFGEVFTKKLKLGDKGKEVEDLQKKLIALGYLDEKGADGIWGPKTQAAFKKFQEARGLTADGIYDRKSFETLSKDIEAISDGFKKKLSVGDKGKEVQELQDWLVELGYLDKTLANGKFGAETRAALKSYQETRKMLASGVYDPRTYESIKRDIEKMHELEADIGKTGFQVRDDYEKYEFELGDKGEYVKALQKELVEWGYLDKKDLDGIFGEKTQAGYEAYKKARQNAVKDLQMKLSKLGYINDEDITGIFDKKTESKLKQFQQEHNLQITGNYDLETYDTLGIAIKNIEKPIVDMGTALSYVERISKGAFSALDVLKQGVELLGNAFDFALEMSNPLIGTLLNIAAAVGDSLVSFDDYLKTSRILNDLFEDFKRTLAPFGGWIIDISNGLSELFGSEDKIKKTFGPTIDLLSSMFQVFQSIFRIAAKVVYFIGEIGKRVIDVFSPVWNMISKIFQAGVKLFGAFADRFAIFERSFTSGSTFSEWLEKIDSALPAFKEKIQSVCDSILTFIGLSGDLDSIDFAKTVDNIIESIKRFFGIGIDSSAIAEGIDEKSAVEAIKEKIIGIYTGIKNWIIGLFGKDGASGENGVLKIDAYKISLGVVGIAIALIAKRLYEITGVFVKTGKRINGFIKQLSSTAKAFKMSKKYENWEKLSEVLLNLAKSIALIAAALFALSKLKWQEIIVGLVGLVAIIGLLIGTVAALKAITKNAKGLDAAFGAIISLGIAIGLLAASVVALSGLSWNQLFVGLVGTLGLISMCIGAMYVLSKMDLNIQKISGVIGIFFSLGSSLSMMTGVVQSLGKIDTGVLIKGFISMGVLMTMLALFTRALNGVKISAAAVLSVLSVSVAINLLIVGFLAMSFAMKLLEINDIIKGIIGIGVIVFTLSRMMKKIKKIEPNVKGILSLIPIAVAIDLLVAGFLAMAFAMKALTFGDIVKAFVSIGIMIFAMMFLMKKINKISRSSAPSIKAILALLPVAAALDLLVLGFLGLAIGLKGVSIGGMIKAIAGLFVLIFAVTTMTKKLNDVKPSIRGVLALIPVTVALDVAIAGFVILAMAMKSIDTGTLLKSIVSLGIVIAAIALTCKYLTKLTSGVSGFKAALMIIPIVLGLTALTVVFSVFTNSLKGVDGNTLIKALAGLITIVIGMKALMKAISKSSINLRKVIAFVASAGALSLAMLVFAHSLNKLRGIDSGAMLAFSTAISEMLIAVSIAGAIAGKVGALNSFLGIVAIVGAMTVVIAALSGLLSIPEVEKFFASGAEKLGKLVGNFIGAMKAAEFESFAKAIDEMGSVGGVDQSRVDNALFVAQKIADFGAGLPAKGLLEQAADFFFGSELKQFSGDMAEFGRSFNKFAKEIGSIAAETGDLESKTSAAISIAESIQKFAAGLPSKDFIESAADALFGSELKQFSGDMVSFGTSFNGFAKEISVIQDFGELDTKTDNAIKIAESIQKFGENLKEKTVEESIVDAIFGSELTQFSGDMVSFGSAYNSYAGEMNKISGEVTDLESKTTTAISIVESIKRFSDSLVQNSVGETVVEAIFGSELKQFSGDIVSFGQGYNSYAAEMEKISDNVENLENKTSSAVSIAESIKKFSDSLTQNSVAETVFEKVFGSELSQFSGDMVSFGQGYNSYALEMGKISDDVGELESKTNNAISIAESIKKFSDSLTQNSVAETVFEKVFGSELSQFSGDMTTFAEKFNKYSETMSGIKIAPVLGINTLTAIGIAGQIKALSDGLAEKDIKTKITDTIFGSAFDQFSGDMTQFAEQFNKYAETMGGITANLPDVIIKTGKAISIATVIATFLETVSGMDIERKAQGISAWFGEQTTGETVISSITELASAISGSSDAFSGISEGTLLEDVEAAMKALTSVATFLNYLSSDAVKINTTYADDYGGFAGDKLINLLSQLTTITDKITEFGRMNSDTDLGSIAIIVQAITDFMNLISLTGEVKGEEFFKELTPELISSKFAEIAISMASAVEGHSADYIGSGKSIGEYLSLGLAQGIEGKGETAISAAEALAQKMLDSFSRVIDSNSPSLEMMKRGEWFVEGFVQGVNKNAVSAEGSSEALGKAALYAFAESIDAHSPAREMAKQALNYVNGFTETVDNAKGVVETATGELGKAAVDSFSAAVQNGEGFGGAVSNVFSGLVDSLFSSDNGQATDAVKGLFGSESAEDLGGAINGYIDQATGEINLEGLSTELSGYGIDTSNIESTIDHVSEYAKDTFSGLSIDNAFNGTLRYGSRGQAVKNMQKMLMDLGYSLDKYGADGIFGPETQAALNRFKQDYGQITDGLFDEKTYEKLTEAYTNSSAVKAYNDTGDSVSSWIESGINKSTVNTKRFVTAITQDLNKYISEFTIVGGNFVKGLINGVDFQTAAAVEAAGYVARRMLENLRTVFNTNSPSKETQLIGQYFTEGLAIGTEQNATLASNSAGGVAEGMLEAAKTSLAMLYTLLDDGIEAEPVIAPVVDLTNVRSAADSISDIFGTRHKTGLTITRNLANKAENSSALLKASDNTADTTNKELTSMLGRLNDRIDALGNDLQSMQVYLDGSTLVGYVSPQVDRNLGKGALLAGRMN